MEKRAGYSIEYVRVAKDPDQEEWSYTREDGDGNVVDSGKYKVNPYIALRWCAVAGENYGRSHREDIIGDISTLESFTESLLEGVAAGPLSGLVSTPLVLQNLMTLQELVMVLSLLLGKKMFTAISPANTMNSQIQATQQGVELWKQK